MKQTLVKLFKPFRDSKVRAAYAFVALPVVLVTIFAWIPSFTTILLSFTKYEIVKPPEYVGLKNWIRLFQDDKVLMSLRSTFIFMLGHVPIIVVFGLTLALIFNERWFKGRIVARTVYFLPLIVSTVAAAVVWNWLLNPAYGMVNRFLEILGLEKQNWLKDPVLAMPTVIFVSIWKNVGFYLVVFLAALQGIPSEYYEAGRIDGTNRWSELWYITLPSLKNTMAFATVIGVIGSFQVFEQVYIMTQGGPMDRTRVIVYHLWWTGFSRMRMGYSSAMAVIVFMVILLITLIQMRLYRGERG
jgi:multiple sugar transport system permease protein